MEILTAIKSMFASIIFTGSLFNFVPIEETELNKVATEESVLQAPSPIVVNPTEKPILQQQTKMVEPSKLKVTEKSKVQPKTKPQVKPKVMKKPKSKAKPQSKVAEKPKPKAQPKKEKPVVNKTSMSDKEYYAYLQKIGAVQQPTTKSVVFVEGVNMEKDENPLFP